MAKSKLSPLEFNLIVHLAYQYSRYEDANPDVGMGRFTEDFIDEALASEHLYVTSKLRNKLVVALQEKIYPPNAPEFSIKQDKPLTPSPEDDLYYEDEGEEYEDDFLYFDGTN